MGICPTDNNPSWFPSVFQFSVINTSFRYTKTAQHTGTRTHEYIDYTYYIYNAIQSQLKQTTGT